MTGHEVARPTADAAQVLAGGGAMGALMRSIDWSRTPVGPVDGWPSSLRTSVQLILESRYPMMVVWGADLLQFYNDAYRPILGSSKHPAALAAPVAQSWPEAYDVIGPLFHSVLDTGRAVWFDDLLLPVNRNGFLEETHFGFSYSAVRDEAGNVAGVLVTCQETTSKVLGERRLNVLRDLASDTAGARTAEDAGRIAVAALGGDRADLPFTLLYLLDSAEGTARLAGASGLTAGEPAAPWAISPDNGDAGWPVHTVVTTMQPTTVSDLELRFGGLSVAASPPWDMPPWRATPRTAVVLPIGGAGQVRPAGALVAGISPYLALDDGYRHFLELVAGQVATAIANARAYEEERRRAEALAELDRAKTAFFGNVSHEFRTPLTLLLGPLEEALARREGDPGAAPPPDLAMAHRNALRLLRLVNSLLDFAQIEAGRIQAAYEQTDLAAATADLASVFRSAIERAGLRFLVDCPPLPEPIYVDREMWEKVVLNLLSNAFKHTFAGEVAVTLRPAGQTVVLSVRDTGTGVPAAELPHLFERFHRVRGARARSHEGSGIGLALVQELARLHGGAVAVESTEGEGSTFAVTLPTGLAHLPADRIVAPRPETAAQAAAPFVEEALRWLPDGTEGRRGDEEMRSGGDEEKRGPTPSPHPPVTSSPRRPSVLLADDNADMRDYVRRLLSPRYGVEAVADGEAALAVARERRPDLVLADVMMPCLDGFGLLRALRADERTRLIPVLLLSARAGEESRVEGLGAGADDYLVKPFSARELLARVDAHMELARVRADAAERLRDAQQRLQLALSAARTVAWQWDEATGAVRWSGNIQAVLGIPSDAPSDRSAFLCSLIHPDDLPHLLAAIREGMARCSDYQDQVRMTRPDTGATIWVEVYGRCSGDASGTPVRLDGVVVDITDRKQAEALLADRRSEAERAYAQAEAERARLQQVLDVLPAGVAIATSDGHFALSNRAAREMLGFDFTGQAMPVTDSGAYDEYGARRSDGTPIPSAELPLQRAVLRGETVRGERFFMRNARTGREFPVLADSAPLLNGDDRNLGGIVVFQDITAIYDLEQQKDAFLSAASHDLQQPVAAIKGNAQLLRRWLTRDVPADQDRLLTGLAHVEKATDQLADQIAELLDVSRLQMGRPLDLHCSPTDLVTLVQQTVSDYRAAGEDHDWRLEAQIESLVADVDAARLRRVLDNLLSNAVKFSPAGTEIVVTIDREAVEGREWAVLAVRDRGMGIPAVDLPHIFERFYRAGNAEGRIAGAGIGLAGARHIVEQHGGSLVAASVEGDGATFTIRLPLQAPG